MEITSLTVSTSKKINHAVYGGEQYESSDHFASLSADLEEGEDLITAHRHLMEACRELVNTSASQEILKMQGGISWERFFEVARKYRLNRVLDGDSSIESQKMNQLQRQIMNEIKLLMRDKKEIQDKGTDDITYELDKTQ